MGEPVKILDLAQSMIRLSGKEPERDIPIEFIGVARRREAARGALGRRRDRRRDGAPEDPRARRPPVDGVWLEDELGALERLVEAGETLEVVSRLSAMVRASQRRVGVAQSDTVSEQTLH